MMPRSSSDSLGVDEERGTGAALEAGCLQLDLVEQPGQVQRDALAHGDRLLRGGIEDALVYLHSAHLRHQYRDPHAMGQGPIRSQLTAVVAAAGSRTGPSGRRPTNRAGTGTASLAS